MESTAVRIEFNSDSVKQVMKDGKTRSLPGRFSRFDVEPGDVLILNYPKNTGEVLTIKSQIPVVKLQTVFTE